MNTMNHSGLLSLVLHWTSAILVLAMLILGWSFDSQPIESIPSLLIYHLLGGLAVLILSLIRILSAPKYRTSHLTEPPSARAVIKRSVHFGLYLLLIAVPVAGILSLAGHDTVIYLYGDISLQQTFAFLNHCDFNASYLMHKWLVNSLTVMIFIHVSAAILIHFYEKTYDGKHNDE